MAGAFLQWRARKATMMLGQKQRSCYGSARHTVEARERQWSGECVRAGAGLLLELGRATWRRRQRMHATWRSPPEPVSHGNPDGFLKHFLNFSIQCSMVMTYSTYSTRQHG